MTDPNDIKNRDRQFEDNWTDDTEESNWSDEDDDLETHAGYPQTDADLPPLPELKMPDSPPIKESAAETPSVEPEFTAVSSTEEEREEIPPPSPSSEADEAIHSASIEREETATDEAIHSASIEREETAAEVEQPHVETAASEHFEDESEPSEPAISEPIQEVEFSAVEPKEFVPEAPLEPLEDVWHTAEIRDEEETISVSFETPQNEVGEVAVDREPERIDPEPSAPKDFESDDLRDEIAALKRQKHSLQQEIEALQAQKNSLATQQMAQLQAALDRLTQENLQDLEERKKSLQSSVEQLERRRDRIREEMRASFAGVSQDIAIRVQGFKDYLVGSLQDLTAAAEQLELPKFEARPEPREEPRMRRESRRPPEEAPTPRFAKPGFQEQRRQIEALLDQYRARPDYYGPPWQLRRTFEPIHAERVQKWFMSQGGRGAVRTMGSRLQNILIASAAMSVLRNLYGERLRVLVLSNTPERLGEWRRGLQDCLGISRSDFGPTRGVVLFESPEALVQKAERFTEEKLLPLVVIDESEGQLDLSLLQFPLLLAFAPDPNSMSSYSF